LKNLCSSITELDKIANMDFMTVITWLELGKANEEIDYINTELQKKK